MKWWIVKLEFVGLTGKYQSSVDVRARDAASAEKKASRVIGNRDGRVISVQTALDHAKSAISSCEARNNRLFGGVQ